MLSPAELTGFLKSLCRYYSDFLETDFHASRNPSRQIVLSGKKGQTLGFDLSHYPVFASQALRGLLGRFEEPLPPIVRPAEYRQADALADDDPDLDGEDQSVSLYRRTLEIYKNRELLDKHNAYLYFFPFTFESFSYPLIFVPVDLGLSDVQDSITIDAAPVIYINVRAIQHVVRLLSERHNVRWTVDVPDRQLFLGSISDRELAVELQRLLNNLTDISEGPALDLRQIGGSSLGKGLRVQIGAYLVVAPQGDEALVTDYEDLLVRLQTSPDDPSIAGMLDVIEKFLFQNPVSVTRDVEQELASEPMTSRIAYPSPIPLNTEQLLVARALRRDECTRVVIEGPPGTGKSHTITGLVFEALQDGRSVLLVSDKKEALDVVEDKINSVLDAAKMDDTFQNPILRLGTKNNNFAKIFFEGNLVKIRARQSALRGREAAHSAAIAALQVAIRDNADDEIQARMSLRSPIAASAIQFEDQQVKFLSLLDVKESDLLTQGRLRELSQAVEAARSAIDKLTAATSLAKIGSAAKLIERLSSVRRGLEELCKINVSESRFLADVSRLNVTELEDYPALILSFRKPIIGYFFARRDLEALKLVILSSFPSSGINKPQEHLSEMTTDAKAFKRAIALDEDLLPLRLDSLTILKNGEARRLREIVSAALEAIVALRTVVASIPNTAAALGVSLTNLSSIVKSTPFLNATLIEEYETYTSHVAKLTEITSRAQPAQYLHHRDQLQKRLTLTMSSLLDKSVLRFNDEAKANAVTIRKLIRERKQVPRSLLPSLAEAFPCIIIGIRELGAYIPFEFGVFDLVIIDEASQVSIAQALPAILRAKKAVVLGDPRQFSNVKAAFASSDLNNSAFSRVRETLSEVIKSKDRSRAREMVDKAQVFNIKTSVLEFVRYLANYNAFLRKHFRGYNELIAYSNETFYQHMLQVMKIRSRPISEVIAFRFIDASSSPAIKRENINMAEATAVLHELEQLIEIGFAGSVAVITPFTQQQSVILSLSMASRYSREFRAKLKLKVMTFDRAQGEERDLVMYSMVERSEENTLRFIFPMSISASQAEEDGDLRRQRLNVGLSRAKESVLFFISKPLTEFTGEIGKALRSFEAHLHEPDFASLVSKTDARSPREAEILQMISQTDFYRSEKEWLEIKPQFPIGAMIKQLDPLANVPSYVSDFLLIYSPPGERPRNAIVEYDGVEAHFREVAGISADNYDLHRAQGDVERMRTIESYGYPIISLNKFMLGRDPIGVINDRLSEALKKKTSDFEQRVGALLNKYLPTQTRRCLRCGFDRPIEAYFSERLETGAGRVCSTCDPRRGLDPELPKRKRAVKAVSSVANADTPPVRRAKMSMPIQTKTAEPGFFEGRLPSVAELQLQVSLLAREDGLPSTKEQLYRIVRTKLFGRQWLRKSRRLQFDRDFESVVMLLYSDGKRNPKYGEPS